MIQRIFYFFETPGQYLIVKLALFASFTQHTIVHAKFEFAHLK